MKVELLTDEDIRTIALLGQAKNGAANLAKNYRAERNAYIMKYEVHYSRGEYAHAQIAEQRASRYENAALFTELIAAQHTNISE